MALSLVCLVFSEAPAGAADSRYDVYFVAIGSDNYVQPSDAELFHFAPLENAADRSALRVAELLQHGGARFGVSVVSNGSRYVDRADITGALDRVHAELIHARPAHPMLVFYFAGHGVSEGIAWNQFLIPAISQAGKKFPTFPSRIWR